MSKRACSFAGESDLFLLCLKGNCLARYSLTMNSSIRASRMEVYNSTGSTRKINIRLSFSDCAYLRIRGASRDRKTVLDKIKRTLACFWNLHFRILDTFARRNVLGFRASNAFGNF